MDDTLLIFGLLAVALLALLCSADNAGKGNRYADDWREPSHPHRRHG